MSYALNILITPESGTSLDQIAHEAIEVKRVHHLQKVVLHWGPIYLQIGPEMTEEGLISHIYLQRAQYERMMLRHS